MPLVAHNGLPSFKRLLDRGLNVLTPEQAREHSGRELHVGLLNMMPDAALLATERQFMALMGSSKVDDKIFVYPFSIRELNRRAEATEHIEEHYFEFPDLVDQGLNALIITGANVIDASLDKEPIWEPLIAVADWAEKNVASTLCSCLASHALLKYHYQIDRVPLPLKQWGVYEHSVRRADHPLMRNVSGTFNAPHSRWNDIARSQLEDAGLTVLAESDEVGVHMAVSPDQFRTVYTQGHPEYDANSLLKEYKREVFRYLRGELETAPPYPEHYLPDVARELASDFLKSTAEVEDRWSRSEDFPENALTQYVNNSWGDVGSAIVYNWLQLVTRLSSLDRGQQLAPGVDPLNPLELDPGGT
ncbi:MAG: homoserine O-succinyltransferase [Candidatus Rariloculaceae bacterium]